MIVEHAAIFLWLFTGDVIVEHAAKFLWLFTGDEM